MNTEQLYSKMDDSIGNLAFQLEHLYHIQQELGHMTAEANDKYTGDKRAFFLWDNSSLLNMMDALLFRLVKEMRETHEEFVSIQEQLKEQKKMPSPDGDQEKATL